MRRVLPVLLMLFAGKSYATGEINVLTDLNSPFPPGCISLWLPEGPTSTDNTLYDRTIWAPTSDPTTPDARVRITVWRVGCHDPGHSVVMVRMRQNSGEGEVLVPEIWADAGVVDVAWHRAQLIGKPAVGDIGATGNYVGTQGRTWMLAVDPVSVDDETLFSVDDYNNLFTLELSWYPFDPGAIDSVLIDVDSYAPQLDPPQFEYPPLHGRMSGQYTIEGIPASGLVLHIGEQADDTNYAFALFFTYLDGEPAWVAGNTGGMEPGFDLVDLDMQYLVGGEFFGFGPDLFDDDDIDRIPIGWMTIEALDCNTLLLGYDFTESGLGTGVTEANRLVRVAGYDCNPWD
jgi:hypothetical protein